MSRQQTRMQDLQLEHELMERSQVSPYIDTMEQYYLANSANFRGKIMLAQWIPKDVRRHMIAHIANRLALKARRRQVPRRLVFRTLVRDPAAKRAESKQFRYGKRMDGVVYKRAKSDGRFVAFSQAERREVERWRAKTT